MTGGDGRAARGSISSCQVGVLLPGENDSLSVRRVTEKFPIAVISHRACRCQPPTVGPPCHNLSDARRGAKPKSTSGGGRSCNYDFHIESSQGLIWPSLAGIVISASFFLRFRLTAKEVAGQIPLTGAKSTEIRNGLI